MFTNAEFYNGFKSGKKKLEKSLPRKSYDQKNGHE